MPTMNVSLTPEFIRFIENEVESGAYASASEVVRDALRLLQKGQEERALRLAQLKSAVETGLGQMERGEFSSRSVEEIFDSIAGEVGR
jgi:antitoxin ParD1/3/4